MVTTKEIQVNLSDQDKISQVEAMCIESLPPHDIAKWIEVKESLIRHRKINQ